MIVKQKIARWIFGFGLIAAIYLITLKSCSDPIEVLNIYPSQNNQFKAIVFNQNGGGAIAPYCVDFVAIVPTEKFDKTSDVETYAKDQRYLIYAAGCHTLPYLPNQHAPVLAWLSDTELQVTFSRLEASKGINKLITKESIFNGQVTIFYINENYSKTNNNL